MDVSVIIVNFNTKKLTEQAISSVYKFTKGIIFEIIVVDNASTDGSQQLITKKFPQVRLISNKKNVGFGAANNQGMETANGKYLFLLNSDAYFMENSLKKLFDLSEGPSLKTANQPETEPKSFKRDGPLFVLAPLLLNEDRSVQQSAGYLPNLLQVFSWMSFLDDLPFGYLLSPYHVDNDGFYKKESEVGWTTGAAMFIPKKVFTKTGGFDENIFMYGEEVEWCWRIKKAGFKVIFSPVTKLVHIGRGSQNKNLLPAIIGEYKGLIFLYKKHKGAVSLQILMLLLKIGALARILIFGAIGRRELAKIYVEAFKIV